ncbi:pF09903 family protein [Clostridium sp. CAG:451]|nr:pF09903 family protein [Clostridium sp. CAG:451]
MNEIKCPNCGTVFKIDEKQYDSIVKQVRDSEFKNEIATRQEQYEKDKNQAIKLAENELEKKLSTMLKEKDLEITKLNEELKSKKQLEDSLVENTKIKTANEYKEEIAKLNIKIKELENEKDKNISSLKSQLELDSKEYALKEKNIKDVYENKLKDKDEMIAYYKDMKARQSTKMIGESLEVHCNNEFNTLRPLFPNAYFEKDNDARTGSKGDFIFRDYDDEKTEIVSIMFEMKNEADMTATKHKNEDFFKELDKDRKEKKCEYAVLVSLLEIDNDYYNTGIVDVSYRYPKMYVIRPQFFIPLITLIRGAALNALEYKKEMLVLQNQNIDISHFEENMNAFKSGFAKNYRIASEKFSKAIEEIDKTIDHLQKTKDALISSDRNLRLANNKAEELTIKRLTRNSETMAKLFAEEQNKKDE